MQLSQTSKDTIPWADRLSTTLTMVNETEKFAHVATTRSPSDSLPGRPACRTIKLLAFHNGTIRFVSDIRSAKVQDIIASPHAELCWYIHSLSLQFRVCGDARVLASNLESDAMWVTLTPEERIWWAWPAPGSPWTDDESFKVEPPTIAPSNFCVFEIEPQRVEVLDSSVAPFDRMVYTLEQGEEPTWNGRKVNP